MAEAKDYHSIKECPIKHHGAEYRKSGDRKDGPVKCTWYPGTTEKSPHEHYRPKPGLIYNTILERVGDTPLVRLNRVGVDDGFECEFLAKCEFFNAGGSVKDRIGKRMVEDAEKAGRIKPGDTLIEPTSGNTGIGIALAAAVKGYRCIITMPEKMSMEKVSVLKALGAEIIRTPTEAAFDAPDSHIGVAMRLNKEIPNSHILDQYANPANPLSHYDGTAEEILESCEGKVDMLVAGAGTGGTITGLARKIKERCPDCIVVGVDPVGSILAEPERVNEYKRLEGYEIEGIGYDFIPTVLDREIVDKWYKIEDKEAFITARRLIREEGLLCGGSCGTATTAAMLAARDYGLGKGKRVVILLADSIRNYISKFVNNDWCWDRGIVDEARGIGVADAQSSGQWWGSYSVRALTLPMPCTITPAVTCGAAVKILAEEGFDQLPVVADDGNVVGVVTEGNLTAKLTAGRVKPADSVTQAMFKKFHKVTFETPLADLARIFDNAHFALVTSTQTCFDGTGARTERTVVSAIASRIDLLKWITEEQAKRESPTPSPRD